MKAIRVAIAVAVMLACSHGANAATKVFVTPLSTNYPNNFYFQLGWYDTTSMTFVHLSTLLLPKDNSITGSNVAIAACKTFIYSEATSLGYTITDADIIANWSIDGVPLSLSFNNIASHSLTSGTGATGFQVSATRAAVVSYSLTIVTTASIGGNASGTVVLEIAPTNSSSAGDWVEIGRITNGQSISLALTLQSVQTSAQTIMGVIPAGYYAKLRTINNAGSPSFSYSSGQEILN